MKELCEAKTLYQPDDPPAVFRVATSAGEAQEHLRVIRQAMERSSKHSTLSGLSGVLAGLYALTASLLTRDLMPRMGAADGAASRLQFVAIWGATLVLALVTDIVLTKRRAAQVGKTTFSPLGRQLARAVAPGLLAGLAVTAFMLLHPAALGPYLYGFWMLCYAVSLLSIGMFSVREVSLMGWAFLAVGTVSLLLPPDAPIGPRALMALSFGGFHIVYGVWMGVKHGW